MAQQRRLEQQLKAGIRAAQQGDKDKAREILEEVVKQSPNNEVAWIWLASVMTTTSARRVCLERVLKINPKNERARQALNRLVGVGGDSTQALDTERLVASARRSDQPARQSRPNTGQQQPARRRRRGIPRRQLRLALAGVAVVLLLALIPTLLLPNVGTLFPAAATETPTPTNTRVAQAPPTPIPTETPTLDPFAPTPTFSGVLVTRQPTVEFPTDTPTVGPTVTNTVPPTPTSRPPTDYTLLFIGESLTGDDSALYRAVGSNDPERLVDGATQFAYDPNQQLLAMVRQVPPSEDEEGNPVGGGAALFTVPLNNPENETALLNLANAAITSLTFSPTGEQLVYASDVDGDTELYLYDLNGNTTIQLTDNTIADDFPTWSPDGRQLVFSTNRDTLDRRKLNFYIFGSNLSDGSVAVLSDSRGDHSMAQWSPDGTELVYTSTSTLGVSVILIDSGGISERDLTLVTPEDDMGPTWSPDGEYIFYLSEQVPGQFQVYSTRPNGVSPTRITNNTLNIRQVKVLPE